MSYLKKFILKIYSIFSTYIENIIFREKNINSEINKVGFFKSRLSYDLFENLKIEKKLIRNQYFNVLILNNKSIENIINKLFLENKISNLISSKTGFNYKVSYLISYETLNIPQNLQNEEVYANKWHFDKPYSKNTIKLIIPLEKIEKNSGAMQIMNIENSKKLNLNTKIFPDHEVTGDTKDLFIFNPNLCAHKAGIPEERSTRRQIMLQLNPSRKWCYSKYLFQKQFKIEPKFPLKNIFESVKVLV